jgi:RNA polymerase sigma-70 factor (ECF subfamily)
LTKNQTDAADLTQETFLILAKHQDHIREPEETKCWLFTTLRREFLRRPLKRASHPEVPFCPEEQDSPATRPSAQHQIDAKLVLSSLAKVDESYRATLELFYVGDLSYKQISTALKIPIGTVMSHLARGKQQLKQILHDEFSEPVRLGFFRPP